MSRQFTEEEKAFLERVKSSRPADTSTKPASRNHLLLRNWLNAAFILLAVGAMVGIVASHTKQALFASYATGIVAVMIKMVEVMIRLPHMKREPRRHNNA